MFCFTSYLANEHLFFQLDSLSLKKKFSAQICVMTPAGSCANSKWWQLLCVSR